jgi:hypothetical protein
LLGLARSDQATRRLETKKRYEDPVDDSYKLPFRFTGKVAKLTFNLGQVQVSSEEHKLIEHALARAKD